MGRQGLEELTGRHFGVVALRKAVLPNGFAGPFRLEEGDSIYFDSHVPHAYVAAGRTQAKFLIVASTLDRPFDSVNPKV